MVNLNVFNFLGAEKFYTRDNNQVRSESVEEARVLDEKIMNAWNGHASLQVIDNHSVANFQAKCDRVVQSVMSRLGLGTFPRFL